MTGTFIIVPENAVPRALTWLGHGQQYTGRLPKGEYDVGSEMDVVYSDLGRPQRGRAVQLVNIENGEKWYVGPAIAERLIRDFKRPMADVGQVD